MTKLYEYTHLSLLNSELEQHLIEGSFASLMRKSLGRELNYWLKEQYELCEVDSYSLVDPVAYLYFWATESGGLDVKWIAQDNGSYSDDTGNPIAPEVEKKYSAIEQLSAYGLWLISWENMYLYGTVPAEGVNEQGWAEADVIGHRSTNLLLAYQALTYANRICSGLKPSAAEEERLKHFDFSALGKIGAKKRHASMAELRAWAVEKYNAGKWPSANSAAHQLRDEVISHGRKIGANLTVQNAQRTIYTWLRQANKDSTD